MVESGPQSEEDEIDLLEVIRILLQAWKTIVGIAIVCVGLAVSYAFHAPEIFKAEILLAPASGGKVRGILCPQSVWWIGRHGGNFHTQ